MNPLLQFNQVSHSYQQSQYSQNILTDVSAMFEAGKFYTITGAPDSGKTSLLSLAGGFEAPKEGEILFEGRDIKKIGYSKYRNQNISFIFQTRHLLPHMTSLENVITSMEIKGYDAKNKKGKALSVLHKVGFNAKQAQQKVRFLNTTEQQCVAIACALSCTFKLLIADEPTEHLQEHTIKELVRLFQSLAHKEGKCVIVSTCNPLLAEISDTNYQLINQSLSITGSNALLNSI